MVTAAAGGQEGANSCKNNVLIVETVMQLNCYMYNIYVQCLYIRLGFTSTCIHIHLNAHLLTKQFHPTHRVSFDPLSVGGHGVPSSILPNIHTFLLPLPLSLHSSNVTPTCMCIHPTLPPSYPLALTIVKLPCIILLSEGLIVAGTLLRSVVTTTRTCLHSIQGTVQHSGVVDR